MEWHDYCPAPLPDPPCIGPDGEPSAEYDCYQCCLDWLKQEAEKMKWVLLITFLVITLVLLFNGGITIKELYIGAVVMLAAEYVEDAIERNNND